MCSTSNKSKKLVDKFSRKEKRGKKRKDAVIKSSQLETSNKLARRSYGLTVELSG